MLLDEGFVTEVVDPHRVLDLVKSGLGGLFRGLAALLENLIDGGDVLLVFLPPGSDRLKFLVEDLLEEAFALDITQAAFLIVGLELVQVGVVRPVEGEMLVAAERVEVGEHSVALDVARVADIYVERVGVHGHDLLAHLVS